MAANPHFLRPYKAKTVSPPLFQIHRFTKKSVVLSADFVAANQRRDRLPLIQI